MLKFLILPAILFLAFAYRLRGGGYYTFANGIFARLAWAFSLPIAYAMITTTDISFIYAASLVGTGFLSVVLVPHAYCQNMGRWPTPQKKWPSFFLPTLADATWIGWPMWKRSGYDAISMAGVCLFRGLIVFLPYAIISIFLNQSLHGIENLISNIFNAVLGIKVFSHNAIDALFALLTIMLLSPAGYLIGWYIPVSLPSNSAKSAEWGETLTGAAWAIALITLLI